MLFGRNPRLPIDVEFGLGISNLVGKTSRSKYVEQLKRRMAFAHQKADEHSKKEKARFKKLYDKKSRGLSLHPDDLVLVKVTAFKGRHKIQDRWEPTEYRVVGQPHPNVPVYKVTPLDGGKSRVLHRNFLLPIESTLEEESEETDSEEDCVAPENIPVRVRRKRPIQSSNKPKVSFLSEPSSADATSTSEIPSGNPTTQPNSLHSTNSSFVSDTTYESSQNVSNETDDSMVGQDKTGIPNTSVDTTESGNSSGNVDIDASKDSIVDSKSDDDTDDDDGPTFPFLRRSSRRTKGFIPDRYGAYVTHSLYAHPPDL